MEALIHGKWVALTRHLSFLDGMMGQLPLFKVKIWLDGCTAVVQRLVRPLELVFQDVCVYEIMLDLCEI